MGVQIRHDEEQRRLVTHPTSVISVLVLAPCALFVCCGGLWCVLVRLCPNAHGCEGCTLARVAVAVVIASVSSICVWMLSWT